ncbi:hypothetical protein H2199_006038 [Coniosporium tulheliwenetii]|uniref:Uncharacterized protein n=1 Tax=Coniosporium tulheliwenetii TaxID=3383036 RepID=A0ACC2YYV3_9PEZI|nr:hypothetical protein H2199_006038 [Cladosporium sp. JES 115]
MSTGAGETQLSGDGAGLPQDTPESTFSSSHRLFVRPSSAGDDPTRHFKFGMAQKQQLDFTGNRKGPAAAQMPTVASKTKTEPAHPAATVSSEEQLSREQESGDTHPVIQAATSNENSTVSAQPPMPNTVPSTSYEANVEPPAERRKRPKKKPRPPSYQPPPPLLQETEDVVPPPTETAPELPKKTGDDMILDIPFDVPVAHDVAKEPPSPRAAHDGKPFDAALHHVSDRVAPVKVMKRTRTNAAPQSFRTSPNPNTFKSSVAAPAASASGRRPTRKAPALQNAATVPAGPGQPSITDMFQFLGWMVQEEQRKQSQTVQAQQALQQRELTSIEAAKQAVEAELTRSKQANQDLAVKLQQSEDKIGRYSERVSGLQKFVGGLGNDLHKLQIESKGFQRQCTELVSESSEQSVERERLKEDIAACVRRSAQIRKDLKQTASEAAVCIQGLEQSKDFLEKQLNEKVGVLVEERDRRVALEKQLQTTIDSQEAIKMLIGRSENHLLDRLVQLAGDIEEGHGKLAENGEQIGGRLAECLTTIRELERPDSTAADDMQRMQEVITHLTLQFDKCLTSIKDMRLDADSARKSQGQNLNEQLQELKSELDVSQSLRAQLDALRESHSTLVASAASKDARMSDLQEQLRNLLSAENSYKNRISDLEAEILRLKTLPPVDGDVDGISRLIEVESQAARLRNELEAARSEVHSGAEKLRISVESEDNLHTQLAKLQSDLKDAENKAAKAIAEENDQERKASERLNDMRRTLSKEAKRLRQEDIADHENKLHQANKKKCDIEASLKEASSALLSTQERLQELDDQCRAKDAQITALLHARAVSDATIKELQHFIDTTGLSKEDSEHMRGELERLKEQSQAKDLEINLLKGEQAANLSKIGTLQGSLDQAETARRSAEAAALRLQEEADAALQESNDATSKEFQCHRELLQAAEDARKQAEIALERSRRKAEAAVKELQERCVREKEDLHQQLTQAEHTKKETELKYQEVRRDAEEALKKQQEKTRGDLGELQRRLYEAEAVTERVRRADQDEIERQRAAGQRLLSAAEERALQAKTELAELRSNLRAQIERQPAPISVSKYHNVKVKDGQDAQSTSSVGKTNSSAFAPQIRFDRPDTSHGVETPPAAVDSEHFKKPRQKVDRNSNSVIERSSQDTAKPLSYVRLADPALLENEDVPHVSFSHEVVPETQPESGPTMSFSQFNESLGRSPPAPRTSSSSLLSELENTRTPSELAMRQSQREKPAVPAAQRALQELPIETVSQRHMNRTPNEQREASSSTGLVVEDEYEEDFSSSTRPKSQANMASRMAPNTQNLFMRQLPTHTEEHLALTMFASTSQRAPQQFGAEVVTKSQNLSPTVVPAAIGRKELCS